MELEVLELNQISEIAPLWAQLNAHHYAQAPMFRAAYARNDWEQRRRELLAKAEHGSLLILVARDHQSIPVAYCVASVSEQAVGELDSLFVRASLRSGGLGHTMVNQALKWMDSQGAKTKRVVVYSGNERAQRFYARFGFAPRHTLMELPSNPDADEVDVPA